MGDRGTHDGRARHGGVPVSVQVETNAEVDHLVARATGAGGEVASAPEQQEWGYSGAFADPDGHLWQVLVPATGGPF